MLETSTSDTTVPEKSDVTRLLDAWSGGDRQALDQLMPMIVGDLRRIAGSHLARESCDHTLQPTALVNEAYLWLMGRRTVRWESRTQFFGFLAQLMRRILVDYARGRKSAKRGSGAATIVFDEALGLPESAGSDLVRVDDALKSLAAFDERQARIVELRFFAGLTVEEIGEVLGVSSKTVQREWKVARLWLSRELDHGRF